MAESSPSSSTISYDRIARCKRTPASLQNMADDCLVHIFQYFDLRDLAAVGETCQRFHNLAMEVYRREFGTDFVMHYHVGARALRLFSSQIYTMTIVSHTYRDSDTNGRTFCGDDVRQKIQLVHRFCKHLKQPMIAILHDWTQPQTAAQGAPVVEMENRLGLIALRAQHDRLVDDVLGELKLEDACNGRRRHDELEYILNSIKLSASINDLTDDNLMLIFDQLTIEELTNCAEVCIRFTAIAQHIFQQKFTTNFLMNHRTNTRILRIFGQQIIEMTIIGAQYLDNACCRNEQYEMLRLVHHYCTNLQILRMDSIHADIFAESCVCKLLRQLSTISFSIRNYRRPNRSIDGYIRNAFEHCDNVKTLNISFVRDGEKMSLDPILMVQYPRLHTLTAWGMISSRHVFSWFCQMHRNIKVLNLALEHDQDNNIDYSDISRMKALHKLWISGEFSHHNAGFGAFLAKLHRLVELRYLHLWGPVTETQLKSFARLKLGHLLYLQMPGLHTIISDTSGWPNRLLAIAKNMPDLIEFRMPDFDWTRNSRGSLDTVCLGLVKFSAAAKSLQRLGTAGGLLINDNVYMKFVQATIQCMAPKKLSLFGFGVHVSASLVDRYQDIVDIRSTDIEFVHTGFD